ncbi:DUF7289 family protein [Natronosalvus caseinilyticus]|uniref:DUF7289 family protein n=1 Tax=Natronosalvus caseinilyticus TaxID=2953747 RepID=UPI0028A77F9C|nr:hypothetical protein [Natronosalvus caseinilyticus]
MSDDADHGDDTLLPRGYSRGQAEVIAVVVLLGFVIVAAVGVVAVGQTALAQLESQSRDEAATQSLEQAKVELASLEPGEGQSIAFSESIEDDVHVKPNDGTLTIAAGGESKTYGLGTIIYERDGTHLAYQGGGLWESTDDGTLLHSAPNVDVITDENQVTNLRVHVTSLQGAERRGQDFTVRSAGTNTSTDSLPEELPPGKMEITIQSSYYDAWAAYFAEQNGIGVGDDDGDVGTVSIDHTNERMQLVIDVPYEFEIDAGITSPPSGTNIEINNNVDMEAYNSADPDEDVDDLEIRFADDVVINHNTQIDADIIIDGELTLDQNNAEINGDIYCVGESADCLTINSGSHNGEMYTTDIELTPLSSTLEIDRQQERITSTENDNEKTEAIDEDGRLTENAITTPGEYYLAEISSEDTLEVDLEDGGEVDILVDGDIVFDEEVLLDSENGHQVNLYMTGDSLTVRDDVNIHENPDMDATNFWILARPGSDISFESGGTTFVGVVYAGNADEEPPARVTFNNNVDFYGGLVASVESVDQNIDFHYDAALIEESSGGGAKRTVTDTTYLRVTVTDILVDED